MESARIDYLSLEKGYGFATVVLFNYICSEEKDEKIYFRFDCGYEIKRGRNKPRFNYKRPIGMHTHTPEIGNYIVFVRKKTHKKTLKDSAKVWGFRDKYKEAWKRIDSINKDKNIIGKIQGVFNQIKFENLKPRPVRLFVGD